MSIAAVVCLLVICVSAVSVFFFRHMAAEKARQRAEVLRRTDEVRRRMERMCARSARWRHEQDQGRVKIAQKD